MNYTLEICFAIVSHNNNILILKVNCIHKLYKPRTTYNTVRGSYSSIRIVNVWNSLLADRVDFSSFASFEHTVQQIDFTPFLLCSHT